MLPSAFSPAVIASSLVRADTSFVPIFAKLTKAKMNWRKVTVVPTDDRLVPVENDLSNAKLLAITSTIFWIAATIAGRLIAYIY